MKNRTLKTEIESLERKIERDRLRSELKPLLACPCGDIPNHLCIEEGSSCKWAWVSGSCCNEWSVEFRTHYFKFDDPKLMDIAVEAWNNAKRAS